MAHSSDARREADGAASGDVQVLHFCDVTDFFQVLAVDPSTDPTGLLTTAARAMFSSPLPPHWSEHVDEGSSRVYFYNGLTGESSWAHPQENLFREVMDEVRHWHADDPLEVVVKRSDEHLRRAHGLAAEGISQWSGPYDAPQGEPEEVRENLEGTAHFFFNAATGESLWVDPRVAAEYDLKQRHAILMECLVAHAQMLAQGGLAGDAPDTQLPYDVTVFATGMWESLGALPLQSPGAEVSMASSAPPSTRRNAYMLEGNDTVRSGMSYLTARSTCSTGNAADSPTVAP